jgi:hypothetical protein
MIAHIIHDSSGAIKSIAFQSTEVDGQFEVRSVDKDDSVTAADLSEVFPENAVDQGTGSSRHLLYLLARDIRTGFRVNVKRKTLEKLK